MTRRVYSHLLDPSVYPDFTRRPLRVPTWKTFKHTTQFTALRAFTQKDGLLVNFREDLDLYEKYNLGRMIWPVFHTVFARNFSELVAEIKIRDLYLFDIWGHVPGSGLEGMWSHVMPPAGMVEYLRQELGERFLGFDNGEQDGRYISGYACQQCPSSADRFKQYLNFQRHFERMCDDLGNQMTTLVSLCFGHYFLKEGNHHLIGAETGQALPNSQVYYAFIRGAGRQYGIHWFGNASVFNRWGYKSYESEGENGVKWGATHGTSLNLLRRLLYTHYLYNAVAIGFEQTWLLGDNTEKRLLGQPVPMENDRSLAKLSPVGEVQASANDFVARNGQPGVMLAPVAMLLDYFAGWAMPRHLYTGNVYQVWGGMPYDPGDYLTHGVLSLLYPGYEDASYFRDERGFLAPTPYGDMTDVLLSDAPEFVLNQYNLVIAAGRLATDDELQDKLRSFVQRGGHLVITAHNARGLFPSWRIGQPETQPPGAVVLWTDGTTTTETGETAFCPVALPTGSEVLARCNDLAAVARVPLGQGRITLLLTPLGLNEKPDLAGPVPNKEEMALSCPFNLLSHVRRVLHEALTEQQLFSVGQGLSFITCRKAPGDYVLGVQNNGLLPCPLKIVSHCGTIRKLSELDIDQRAKDMVGYWPTGREGHDGGTSDRQTISGGDVRLFAVTVEHEDILALPPCVPPTAVMGRFLALRDTADVKRSLLARPTFFQHFDGVSLDWTCLRRRDQARMKSEGGWLARQKLRIIVDFSAGLNFYPDLTLLDTLLFRYEQSVAAIDDVLDKMPLWGAAEAVISLHRIPENQCDGPRANDRFLVGVKDLCRRAAQRGITLHLQTHPHKWHPRTRDMLAFIDQVNAENLRFALNVGHAAMAGEDLAECISLAGRRLGLVLISAPKVDAFGQTYDAHLPIHAAPLDLLPLTALHGRVPMVLDADYASWDETYRDLHRLSVSGL